MIGANVELVGVERREHRLREALEPARNDYPFIFLDCPPALDLLTLNSLVAADSLLVPMQAEYFALEGISELMATLDRVSASFNPELRIEGVLLTMYDDRTNLSQQVRDNLQRFFEDKLLKTTIPRNIRLAEAPSHGKPVALIRSAIAWRRGLPELALELLERNGMKPRKSRGQSRTLPSGENRRDRRASGRFASSGACADRLRMLHQFGQTGLSSTGRRLDTTMANQVDQHDASASEQAPGTGQGAGVAVAVHGRLRPRPSP